MYGKKPIHHLAAGLIIALAVLFVSVVLAFVNGANAGAGVGWIGMVVLIIGLVFFVQQYGKAVDHQASFGDYFNYGFKATTMVVLLNVLYLLVLSLAVPDIKHNLLETTRLELERQKNLGEADRARALELTDKYFWMALVGVTVFLLALFGAVGSLIGAAVTKKLPKNASGQTSV